MTKGPHQTQRAKTVKFKNDCGKIRTRTKYW